MKLDPCWYCECDLPSERVVYYSKGMMREFCSVKCRDFYIFLLPINKPKPKPLWRRLLCLR